MIKAYFKASALLIMCSLFFATLPVQAQSLSGNVNTEEGSSLGYANVNIYKGEVLVASVFTDKSGNFYVKLDTGTYRCEVEYVGHHTEISTIIVLEDETTDIALKRDKEYMEHVVYLDAKAKVLENVILGIKTLIVRGATGRKMPYGRVSESDTLYFIENNGDGLVSAKGVVKSVYESEKQSPEDSARMLAENQAKTMLSEALVKRFSKRYLILIEIENVKKIDSLKIDRSNYGNMDDWLPVEDIESVRL